MERVVLGGILAPCSAAQRHNLQILCLYAAIKELLLLISTTSVLFLEGLSCLHHMFSRSHFPQTEPECSSVLYANISIVYTGFLLSHFHLLVMLTRKHVNCIRSKRQHGLDDCVFMTSRVPHVGDSHLQKHTYKHLKHLLQTHMQKLYSSIYFHHSTRRPLRLEPVILFTTVSLKSISDFTQVVVMHNFPACTTRLPYHTKLSFDERSHCSFL